MKVRFLVDATISNQIEINKGDVFDAKEDGKYIMIRMEDDSTVKAPKEDIKGILEIFE